MQENQGRTSLDTESNGGRGIQHCWTEHVSEQICVKCSAWAEIVNTNKLGFLAVVLGILTVPTGNGEDCAQGSAWVLSALKLQELKQKPNLVGDFQGQGG